MLHAHSIATLYCIIILLVIITTVGFYLTSQTVLVISKEGTPRSLKEALLQSLYCHRNNHYEFLAHQLHKILTTVHYNCRLRSWVKSSNKKVGFAAL